MFTGCSLVGTFILSMLDHITGLYLILTCILLHWNMYLISWLILKPTLSSPCMLLCSQRNSAGSENPSDVFRFLVEERIQCCQTRRVRYTQRVDYCIQLPAPMEAATNRGEGALYAHIHWKCSVPTVLSKKPQLPLVGMTLGSGGSSSWENQPVLL